MLRHHAEIRWSLSISGPADNALWTAESDGSAAVPIRGNFQASNGDALVAAALAGQGLVDEPTFLLGDIRAGRPVALTLDQPPMELPGVLAVYASDRRPPAKVRAFIDFLVQRLGRAPSRDRGLALPGWGPWRARRWRGNTLPFITRLPTRIGTALWYTIFMKPLDAATIHPLYCDRR